MDAKVIEDQEKRAKPPMAKYLPRLSQAMRQRTSQRSAAYLMLFYQTERKRTWDHSRSRLAPPREWEEFGELETDHGTAYEWQNYQQVE